MDDGDSSTDDGDENKNVLSHTGDTYVDKPQIGCIIAVVAASTVVFAGLLSLILTVFCASDDCCCKKRDCSESCYCWRELGAAAGA